MSALGMVSTVAKRSLDKAAADALREAIVSGQVRPGARLTEVELATQFDLSRGTIRAALQRLMAEGLIVQRPYAGWEVASLTSHDAWELYTLRASLEGLAARLAAQHADRHSRMEAAFEALKSAVNSGSGRDINEADLALHKAMVSLAGHRRLAGQYDLVEQQVRMYMASSNAILPERGMVIANHAPLVAAVTDGDPDVAEQFARIHSTSSGEILVRHLREQEEALAEEGTETALRRGSD
ncbi:GntR family transcriptional regulator [Xanthobacter sp. DSM 24535]|uniref:GntR family transcriptional regulator n=1 Tax=Roseixanthobacter psychrophilus TaxID=3119917 RepID=UPI00372A4757